MIITREEYEKLKEAALVGFATMPESEKYEGRNLVARIDHHINDVDRINGRKATKITIGLCANP